MSESRKQLSSVAFDATHFATNQPTGVEHYVDALLPSVSSGLVTAGVKVWWLVHQPLSEELVPDGVEVVVAPYRKGWSQLGILTVLRRLQPQLYVTLSGLPPVLWSGQCALTVHDLGALAHPEVYSVAARWRLQSLQQMVSKRAAAIFVPSQFVADDVSRRWKVATNRLVTTPLGLDVPPQQRLRPAGLPSDLGRYVLFVSRVETKKNLSTLISAVAANEKLSLVIAGKPGYGFEQIQQQLTQLPDAAQARIHLLGYVSEPEKWWLLQHAATVAAPCPDEGFGLPALEARSCGVPVVSAQAGALQEIRDEGVYFVPPYDVAAWTAALEQAVSRGYVPSVLNEQYRWQTTAQKMIDAFLRLG